MIERKSHRSWQIGYMFWAISDRIYLWRKARRMDIRYRGQRQCGHDQFAARAWAGRLERSLLPGDLLKAIFAVLLIKLIFGGISTDAGTRVLELYAGFGAVLGHNFPCYLQFKGGEGNRLYVRCDPCCVSAGCANLPVTVYSGSVANHKICFAGFHSGGDVVI